MVSVRAAKSKGATFEYDCQYNLEKIYPEIYRTSERGFKLQYDLECDSAVFECKRLKSLSWNQAKKYFDKLVSVAPEGKEPYLLFKSNRQPCLVMFRTELNPEGTEWFHTIAPFKNVFDIEFEKRPKGYLRNKK